MIRRKREMTIGPPMESIKLDRISIICSGQWVELLAHLVTRMKTLPLSLPNFSFADSEADVEHAGYSPPTPTPAIPRATVL